MKVIILALCFLAVTATETSEPTTEETTTATQKTTQQESLSEDALQKLAVEFVSWLKQRKNGHGVVQQKTAWFDRDGKAHLQETHSVFKREACSRCSRRRGGCKSCGRRG
ncbi:unnamed protein product [Notodromas monacha]|uniref:Uncharacterized protein n=1 Tax=Notodromas monacha TaxID=399045 RepID=A0A7R9BT02_9CRUS|nr:unnamed protein product [Notodromas monacha]CAG0921185.1 unnamed protein product [Notodromas monacha]